jgi:hypothetical protein
MPSGTSNTVTVVSNTPKEAISGPLGERDASRTYSVGTPPIEGASQERTTVVPLTLASRFCGGPGATAATTDSETSEIATLSGRRLFMRGKVFERTFKNKLNEPARACG